MQKGRNGRARANSIMDGQSNNLPNQLVGSNFTNNNSGLAQQAVTTKNAVAALQHRQEQNKPSHTRIIITEDEER